MGMPMTEEAAVTQASVAESAFAALGLRPFAFQTRTWAAIGAGQSGMLHAGTGSGKTYAVWGGLLQHVNWRPGLQVLWVTPMRALAHDSLRALQALSLPHIAIGLRSGDTPSSERQRQDRCSPEVLVTTPESLCLMLSRSLWVARLAGLQAVVVDEWHELLGNKRGVQLQLCLASLRSLTQGRLQTWGMSATLGNLSQAAEILCGPGAVLLESDGPAAAEKIDISTLMPAQGVARFPYAGHLGRSMVPQVAQAIEQASTSLVFTNTRAQAELWYQALLDERPDWAGLIALHHGSLDPSHRTWVEQTLREGRLRAVVATSTLDLGVDFAPVAQVLQVGSPKGMGRLVQRAGRSGHSPEQRSRLVLVPTNSWEIVESLAAQQALRLGRMESRHPPQAPLDVLVQQIATRVLGAPMHPDALYAEVCSAPSYAGLSREDFDWALAHLEHGGQSLQAYPDFHRLQRDEQGRLCMTDARQARRHRLSMGTIVSDATLQLAWMRGGKIGQIEEQFIGRLKPGDRFLYSGRALELVRVKDLTAYVKVAKSSAGAVPRWLGGNMPLSSELAEVLRGLLPGLLSGTTPEAQGLRPMLERLAQQSRIPHPQELLIEQWECREGSHLAVFPLLGRTIHLGMATLMAQRLSAETPRSISVAVNDYGFELLCPPPTRAQRAQALAEGSLFDPVRVRAALRPEQLLQDLLAGASSGTLPLRRFREIARIAGLIQTMVPGASPSSRQLAASASLVYEVFDKYDPDNLLLAQARQEVLQGDWAFDALAAACADLDHRDWVWKSIQGPSPLSFPLVVDRLREKLSSESLQDRIERMLEAAGA